MTHLSRASIAVAHHAPTKRRFVAAVLMPAAERIRGADGIRHVHITRHWRFGPHVQIVASGESHADVTAALHAELNTLTERIAGHRSEYQLDEDGYLAMSDQLGQAELVPPPYAPIWPDNSVRLLDPSLEPGLIEDPAARDLRDAFNEALLEPLEHIMAASEEHRAARIQGAATLMVLLAATYPDRGLYHGYLSYKSHLEDHLQDYDRDGSMRADFDARYGPARRAFENLVGSVVGKVSEPSRYQGEDPVLHRWSDALQGFWERAMELARTGSIAPLLHEGYTERAKDLNDHLRRKYAVGDDREYSEFHAALRDQEYTDPLGGRWFASYRFMVNLLYTQLLVLDVSPAERLFLAHAISEAVQAVTGVSWRAILKPGEGTEAVR
ncbi:hypothetical protein [Nocardiopsis sp. NPDC006832]|uniref:hypothetical protein n=1 Tax=Nocardiopsis sp. NPDC006832 TaxID=3157188 RepID=UPI0033C0D5EA